MAAVDWIIDEIKKSLSSFPKAGSGGREYKGQLALYGRAGTAMGGSS